MNPDKVWGYGGRLHRRFIARRLRKRGTLGRMHAAVNAETKRRKP